MNSKLNLTSTSKKINLELPEKIAKEKKIAERDQIRTRRRYFEQQREKAELEALLKDSFDDY
ncbi:MAG: hypothetical protein HRU06_20550 [Oceanospirillaceae bacterium]|nr:hypothetical protein [Oceanospirillaceae bacterium]